jgi:hypothetical protein
MNIITLHEARKRTGLDLVSDRQIYFADFVTGRHGTVAEGQKAMARRYPLHEEIVDAGKEYFGARGYVVYPRGVTVNGSGVCPDFALLKGSKLVFVECLTAAWSDWDNLRRKAKLARHGSVVFLVEHPDFADLSDPERKRMFGRLRTMATVHGVYLYHPAKRSVSRLLPSTH